MFRCLNAKMLKYKGFSLLETLVVIAVITVGLVGIMGLIVYITSIGQVSPNEIIAANLAQEGIEVVRNIRDSNWLEGNDFDKDIEGNPGVGKRYILELVDPNGNSSDGFKLTAGGVDNIDHSKYQVYYDYECNPPGESPDCLFYAQEHSSPPGDWEETTSDIHRMIEIAEVNIGGGDYYLKVVSQVSWTDRSGPHTIILEDHLYDWR